MKTLLATTAITLLASGPLLAQDTLPEASPPPDAMQTQEMQQQGATPEITPTEGMQAETAPDAAPAEEMQAQDAESGAPESDAMVVESPAAEPEAMQAQSPEKVQNQDAAPGAEPEPLQAQDTPPAADPALADVTTTDTQMADTLFLPAAQEGAMLASDLMGLNVHSSEADYGVYGTDPVAEADRAEWDAIGEINDILVTREGQAAGALVDVGGFLGIGARTVVLDMSQLHILTDEYGDHFVAVNSSREALEAAPEYRHPEEMAAAGDPMATTPATGVGDTAAPVAMTRPTLTREGYQDVDYAALTADQLEGATVYDVNDDSIGDISQLVLADDGTIQNVVLDVGGFLGIGAHSVALDFDELQIMREADGDAVRVYVDETREELEQRPAYEG